MKKSKLLITLLLSVATLGGLTGCGKQQNEFDEKGYMNLSLRNLYFSDWTGGDTYSNYIQDKFKVNLNISSYSWADWDTQVYGPANSNKLSDVFHFDVDSYNFANSYKYWAEGGTTKALPKDMSKWPNVQSAISKLTNVDNLYIDGQLYCLPIIKNLNGSAASYSPFTYVYRRDWAKELNVYQENDVYTWEQFTKLLDAFYKNKCQSGDIAAIADVEWGYPSVTNFYKTAPHCFTKDADGKFVCNYTTSEYMTGLDVAKSWTTGASKYYGYDQYAANDGDVAKQYYAGRVGVFYENLSLSNYTTLRENVAKRLGNAYKKADLDDQTALLKVMGPDGKYALEGTENWFSATFFSADISDEKMEKVLDIMDWLLSDEGTMMALYGIEGYDYTIDGSGNVELTENGWEIDPNTGKYVSKFNGAKYLRYMVTLGYDTNERDPLVDKDALNLLKGWEAEMDAANEAGNLRVLAEDGQVKWLATKEKASKSGSLLSNANTTINKYAYGSITKDEYTAFFKDTNKTSGSDAKTWKTVLDEINNYLGK